MPLEAMPNLVASWRRANVLALEIRKTDRPWPCGRRRPDAMRIAVAMSGGVDSSVAALLLRREGADVVGLSMHLWNHDRDGTGANEGRCCTLDDLSVTAMIGVPHFVLNLENFTEAVVKPFITSSSRGNQSVHGVQHGGQVQEPASEGGGAGVRGGRDRALVRIEADEVTGAPHLFARETARGISRTFLYDLTEEQLSRARFPLGELTKPEVREIAREAGLPNWDKPDSPGDLLRAERLDAAEFIRREAPGLGIPLPALAGARPRKSAMKGREGRNARGNVRLHGRPAARARSLLAGASLHHQPHRKTHVWSWGRHPLFFTRKSSSKAWSVRMVRRDASTLRVLTHPSRHAEQAALLTLADGGRAGPGVRGARPRRRAGTVGRFFRPEPPGGGPRGRCHRAIRRLRLVPLSTHDPFIFQTYA